MTNTIRTPLPIPELKPRPAMRRYSARRDPAAEVPVEVAKAILGSGRKVVALTSSVDLDSDGFISGTEFNTVVANPHQYGFSVDDAERVEMLGQAMRPWQLRLNGESITTDTLAFPRVEVPTLADFNIDVEYTAGRDVDQDPIRFSLHEICTGPAGNQDFYRQLKEHLPDGIITLKDLDALPENFWAKHRNMVDHLRSQMTKQTEEIREAMSGVHIVVPDKQTRRTAIPIDAPFTVAIDSTLAPRAGAIELRHKFVFDNPREVVVAHSGPKRGRLYQISSIDDLGDGRLSIHRDGKLVEQIQIDVDALRAIKPQDEVVDVSDSLAIDLPMFTRRGLDANPPGLLDRLLIMLDRQAVVDDNGKVNFAASRTANLEDTPIPFGMNLLFGRVGVALATAAGPLYAATALYPTTLRSGRIASVVFGAAFTLVCKDLFDIALYSAATGIESLLDDDS